MWSSLVRLLATGAAYYVAVRGTTSSAWSAHQIRDWLIGISVILGSSVIGVCGVLLLMSSLFFQLADMAHLVRPAVITGGVGLLVSFLGLFQGGRWLHRS